MHQRQADADDLLIKIIATMLLVAAGAWGYSRFWPAPDTSSSTAIAPSTDTISPSIEPATAAQAPMVDEAPVLLPHQQASGSAINGKAVYYCTYRGTTSVQTQACVAPWTTSLDAPLPESDISSEQRNRQIAEIKLAQAQEDFAEASGLDRASQMFVPGRQASVQRELSRCQAAKQSREWALEQAGMHRTFDLIRRLNDEVYDACKRT